ncbi:MAG: hypothetical protein WBC44_05285 [Planctomycetaceae bacterium]
MEPKCEKEQFPTGKLVIRRYDGDGKLAEESHSHGLLDIGITMYFTAGVKSSEMYFKKRRAVGRPTYEKARLAYPDMPAADGAVEDFGADLLRGIAQEKRRSATERKTHVPDPERGRAIDEFCLKLMSRGKCADAVEWVRSKNHTLGERNPAGSRRLVQRFTSLDCPKVFACEIDVEVDGNENTGHLVVELPQEPSARSKTLKAIARIAAQQGLQGDSDDGQQYAYIKLD